ncbi:MAG: discoidin domain-containing protein, partial [Planctomycetes bacterium]|nr:discoidin domain-containing protein [Planctomycetota bacterium]
LSRSAAAIDGDIRTAAVSYRNYTGDAITIDLNKTCLFQTIIIYHGTNEFGFAHTVEVAVGSDISAFQTVYITLGTRKVTVVSLPKPVLGRYLRLRAVRAGREPWSLAEVYLQ